MADVLVLEPSFPSIPFERHTTRESGRMNSVGQNRNGRMINSSRSLMSVFVDVLIVRGGRRRNGRVGRDRAGAGVVPHFRPGEERFVTGAIDGAHGNEEAVSGIEAERLR
jgi:hypothetical protein